MMKMQLILLVGVLAISSCGDTTKKTATAEEPAETAPETTISGVLNPNLASTQELLAVPGFTEPIANQLVQGRPYLEPQVFIGFVKENFDSAQSVAVLERLFLPMNLNTTPEDDFLSVPGVGNRMAHEFEEYRPYTSVEQFRREIGKYVDEEQVATYEQYVFVPVNLNTASEEEIMAIPGVGERMKHEFEEYRPYENIEQFRREIGKYVDDDELRRLERYVTL